MRDIVARTRQLIIPESLAQVRLQVEYGDFESAHDACRGLAEAGDAEAQACLAALLWDGVGVTLDRPHAKRWARQSCVAGHGYGEYLLASFAYSHRAHSQASRWMQQSAAKQFPPALLGLGRFYIFGIGVAKDPDAGLACYRQAEALGHRFASYVIWDYRSGASTSATKRWYARGRRLIAMVALQMTTFGRPFYPTTTVRNFR